MKRIKRLCVVIEGNNKISVVVGPVEENKDRAQVNLKSSFGGTFLWDMQGENLECFLSCAPVDDLIKNLFGALWHEIETEKGGYAYQTQIIEVMQNAILAELWDEDEGMFDE